MDKPTQIKPNAGTREAALASIKAVIEQCRAALPDAAAEYALRQLEALKLAAEEQWPLVPQVKKQINLGPFAAKNISDLDVGLADDLMHLDYYLRQ